MFRYLRSGSGSNYQILIEMFYLLKGVWRQLQTTNNKTVFDSNNFSTFPFQSSAKLTFPRVVTLNSSLVLFKIMSYQVHSRNTNKDFYKLLHQGKISTMWNEIVRFHRSAKTEMATQPKRDCHGSSHITAWTPSTTVVDEAKEVFVLIYDVWCWYGGCHRQMSECCPGYLCWCRVDRIITGEYRGMYLNRSLPALLL